MRVLGMISGTSHDGVDTALVEFAQDGDRLRGRLIQAGSEPYPAELRERLIAALPPAEVPLAEVCALDTLLGQHFAARADAALGGQAPDGQGADLICSHGQTVFHWVDGGHALGTLQFGSPAWIAEATGVPVLSDLRTRDVAAGGHGAPLVPILDVLLMGDLPGRSAALNLGGIANMTVMASGTEPIAYDLGPANALIDAAVREYTGGALGFDAGGELGVPPGRSTPTCSPTCSPSRTTDFRHRSPPERNSSTPATWPHSPVGTQRSPAPTWWRP